MGDVFFDLANFSVNHGLGRDDGQRCSRLLRRRAAGRTSVR